jgi:hypothetical protein
MDSGLDSSRGSFVNGGYVVATGATMDWAESDSKQVTMNLQFASDQASDEAIIVTDKNGKVLFAYDPDKDETAGANNRGYRGAVISSPEFKVGETYYVYVGGDVQGTEVDGLYDAATVTGFSGAARQIYTGTEVQKFPGMPPEGDFGRQQGGSDMRGDPFDLFSNISGVTINGDSVTITEAGANNIVAMIQQMNSSVSAKASQFMGITDTSELFSVFDQVMRGSSGGGMGGPGGGMGGPGGGMGGPGGGMGGPGGGMGGPGGGMGGPGGGFGGPGGSSDNGNTGDPSTDFYMKDTVNAFSGVADETK